MSKLPSLCQRGENRVHHETSPGIVIKMPRQILQRDDFLGDVLALVQVLFGVWIMLSKLDIDYYQMHVCTAHPRIFGEHMGNMRNSRVALTRFTTTVPRFFVKFSKSGCSRVFTFINQTRRKLNDR